MSVKSKNAARSAAGTLVISIDLELPANQFGLSQTRMLEFATEQLAQMFHSYSIPATWAVADPVHSAATGRLLELGDEHELAILGDAAWVGREAGRRRFSRELTRRLLGARAAGIEISTLICAEGVLDEHLDLLVKHGITGVRDAVVTSGGRHPAQPQSLRFGLWACRGSMQMPYPSRWHSGSWRTRRGIDGAIAGALYFHLVVDGARFGAQASAKQSLEQVLRHAHLRRAAGQLQIVTLAEMVRKFSPSREAAPSRSILRASA